MDFSDLDLTLTENKILSKKNITTFLIIGILVLVIPFTVKLVERQQTLKSRAAGENAITFVPGDNIECDASGNCTTTDSTVELELKSPIGPPGTIVPTPTTGPTNTPTPTLPPGVPTNTPTPTSSPRDCAVSWSLTPASPSANSTMTIVVTGNNDPQGWQNIGLWRNGQEICRTAVECGFSVGGTPPVFTFTGVGTGPVGDYTLTFKTNNGSRTCGSDQVYTAR